jgi:histidinol phosphatase-like enzyme (inositol monophosphatase family)
MSDESLATLLEFATEIAWHAGRITLAHFQTGVAIERKPDASPVTLADRAVEQFLRERIAERFPQDGVLGEEFGVTHEGARRQWIIDPIDGTRTFVRGVPMYGVMVALEIDGEAQLGVINIPALNEMVSGATGLGCWWNSRRARVSEVARLEDALVVTTSAEGIYKRGHGERWDRLRGSVGLVRTWGDCYGYILVATGRAEAMIDGSLAIWDAAAVAPIIREAGGSVSGIDGADGYKNGSLVATNDKLGGQIRRLLGNGE